MASLYRCTAVAAALAALSAPLYAQNVTLYGLMDVGLERISNVAPNGASLVRMPSITGTLPSRWGVRGSEDLGNGLKAVFTLESGFAPDAGTSGQGGRLFGRQAFVGLQGDWGTATFGRQYTMLFWSFLDADPIGPQTMGLGSLDSYIPNTRADNSVAWRGTFNGITAGAHYTLGRDAANPTPNNPAGTNCGGEVAGDAQACRGWSAMVKYDSQPWGAAAAVDVLRGGTGSWAALGLTSSALTDRRTLLNGYGRIAGIKLGGGVLLRDNDGSTTTPRSRLLFVGASWPVTPALTLDAEWSKLTFRNSANGAKMLVARATYALSKRTAVYTSIGRVDNDGASNYAVSGGAPGGNPAAGAGQNGVLVGVRHAF
jgi:predicted porin